MSKIVTSKSELKKVVTNLPKKKMNKMLLVSTTYIFKERKRIWIICINQIGIDKRVCVVNIKDPLVLVNPRITNRSEELSGLY